MDQESVINLAIQSGVIDSADMESIHISQQYIDDLAHFADLAQQVERANIIDMLERLSDELAAIEDGRGHNVLKMAVAIIKEAAE